MSEILHTVEVWPSDHDFSGDRPRVMPGTQVGYYVKVVPPLEVARAQELATHLSAASGQEIRSVDFRDGAGDGTILTGNQVLLHKDGEQYAAQLGLRALNTLNGLMGIETRAGSGII